MNLETSPFSILNKKRKEMEYIKEIYRRRVQDEIESYNVNEQEDKIDKIEPQEVLINDGSSD